MRITKQGISSFVSALFIVGIVGSAVPVGGPAVPVGHVRDQRTSQLSCITVNSFNPDCVADSDNTLRTRAGNGRIGSSPGRISVQRA